MASKLNPLLAKAAEASKILTKNGKSGAEYYNKLLERNKQYIKDPPTVENCKLLANQLFYTRLARFASVAESNQTDYYFDDMIDHTCEASLFTGASIPNRYQSLVKEVEFVKGIWKNRKEVKTEDVGIAALFGLECFAWFWAGEIVGRGFTFTGYHV
ncbi:OLC1v1029206C1 [Oldenlandia corymbosa var. corymbosa]|uniref:OLC1v1029206C1 n=1 Tax=Oldenlandia corymbosa var. corymbosa TaxID=529605 RepID=A0AAV1CE75_OLDCO|nr:OLC1v1029206C1 [Oldenlandia corymbosa var. corymbosa]